MTTLESLTEFFGWLTVVNLGIYILTVLGVMTMRGLLVSVNTRIFGASEEDIKREAFAYVGRYKLAITLFAFTPWLALTLMA